MEETKQEVKEVKRSKGLKILLINIGAMVVVGALLVWLTMAWLKSYTRQDEVIRVPELVGLSQNDAKAELEQLGLYLQVADSLYDESAVPGVVLHSVPKAGATVKGNRTIYVTVNNQLVKQSPVPEVENQSMRQAEALLRANGFTNVTIKYVAGQFDDLALQVKNSHGRILLPGERVPYNEPLTLEISSREVLELELSAAEGASEVVGENHSSNDGEDWF